MSAAPSYGELAARLGRASTFLFVPGNRPDRFESAWRSSADAVILDLEASVHPVSKESARIEAERWLAGRPEGPTALVRINRLGTDDAVRDWNALAGLKGISIMVSGAEAGPLLKDLLGSARSCHPVVLLVETARGIEQANELAGLPGVCRLAFGNMDFGTELGLGPSHWGLIYASSKLVVASRCANLPPPIAGVTASIRERDVMDSDLRFERDVGFGAKMCVHPEQVPRARAAYEPTPEECAWARRILAVTASSHAVSLDGQMIDRPVIERARRILDRSAGDSNR